MTDELMALQEEREDLAKARLSPLWPKASALLRAEIPASEQQQIRDSIAANPESWSTPYHFWWGMSIRNVLRDRGFGERDFAIRNLDNIYVKLVEEAVEHPLDKAAKIAFVTTLLENAIDAYDKSEEAAKLASEKEYVEGFLKQVKQPEQDKL